MKRLCLLSNYRAVFAALLTSILSMTVFASSQTVYVTLEVGQSQSGLTPSDNVTSEKYNWSQKTAGDASVATVNLTSANNVKKPTASVTAVGVGHTTYVYKNSASYGSDKGYTCTYDITVIEPEAVYTDCGEINLSLGRTCVLTNDSGSAILYSSVTSNITDDAEIAMLVPVTIEGVQYAAVSNAVRDGQAEFMVQTTGGNYRYTVEAITITIEKTVQTPVDQNLWSNATIRIVTHVLNNRKPTPPKVLFMGSMCSYHSLTPYTMGATVNAIAEVADVDWYMINKSTSANSMSGSERHGTEPFIVSGEPTSDSSTAVHKKTGKSVKMQANNHQVIDLFISQIAELIDAGKTNYYDYVIFEFDGSRLFPSYAAQNSREEDVANFLKPFYREGRAIWVVDNNTDSEVYNFADGTNTYCRPCSFCVAGGSANDANDIQYRGLIALLDPVRYSKSGTRETLSQTTGKLTSASKTTASTLYANARNPNQMTYENCGNLTSYLKTMIKPVIYDTELVDSVISVNDTMTIAPGDDSVRVYGLPFKDGDTPPTEGAQAEDPRWRLTNSTYQIAGNMVTVQVNGITNECWRKVEIDICAAPEFLDTAKAYKALHPEWEGIVWSEEDKAWYVNPNDGDAVITLWRGEGSARVQCSASAQAATVLWKYIGPPEEEFAVDSSDVSKIYDGIPTNIVINVTAGPEDPTIQYRKVGDTTWLTYDPAAGFVNVADSGKVEFKVSKEGSSVPDYYGTNSVTIAAAPTKPWNPPDPTDPTDLTPPADPDPSGPCHAWVGAQNIVKCYDGLGTNVVVKYGPSALDASIRYSTNNVDFVAWDELRLTNACAATKIYFSFEKDNYTTITNYAYVTITQRVATITFAAADKVFDNTTDATCTSTNFANVVSGEGFTLDTSAMSFAFDTAAVGSGKTVTATGYGDDKVAVTGDTLKSNYAFDFIDTATASITKDSIEIGGKGPFNNENPPPAPPVKGNSGENESGVKNVIKTYDGTGTNIVVNVTKPASGSEVVYSVDGGVTYLPLGVAPSFTNAVDGTQVWYVVSAPGCDPVTNYAWVTIRPKAVTVTADDKSKVYGAADPMLTAQVAGTLGADTVAYSLSRTLGEDVAGSPYTITASGDALQGNYSVTYYPADFTITKKPVDNPLNPGDPAPGTGLDFGGEGKDKVPYKGTEWEPGVSVTNELGTLTLADYDVTYFDNIDSTNKAGIVITGKGNYSGVFTNYFEITKLKVTITADDKNIVYGSAVPPSSFYTFSGAGFTNGETIAVLIVQPAFGSSYTTTTPVGPIAIAKTADAVARNYTFAYVNGTLTITREAIEIGGKGPFDDENPPPGPPAKNDDSENGSGVRNVIKIYDGVGTNIVVNVTKPVTGSEVVYSVDGGVTYLPLGVAPSFTNAVDGTQVWYKATAPGCATVTNYAWVTVLPKAVTITSGDGDFTYTGIAQSNATAVAVGFVGDEGAVYSNFATVTAVADSGVENNTFDYALKSNTRAENYTITAENGSLTVKPADITPKPPEDSDDPSDPTPPAGGEDDPWTGAPNIVKCFDNTGTNIVAKFANLMPPDLVPSVLYSTNETDWVAWDALQLTNVCEAVRVSYRVTDANYNTLTNSAYVTITNAIISSDGPYDDIPWSTATNIVKVFDGAGTNILAVYGNILPEGTEPTILYSTAEEGPYAARIPDQFVNVTNVEVWYTLEVPNYDVLTNSAWVTITNAVIAKEGPSAPEETDPPSHPGSDACAGAANIVKCFDNLGTNILAQYGNLIPDGIVPAIFYSTNKTDWVAWDALQLTNVCDAVEVFFTVAVDNYHILTNSAYVTITNAIISSGGPYGDIPWSTATNIVKVFDGAGTNILAVYGNILPEGTEPTILYSTDPSGPYAARIPDQFVNVTNVEVWYTLEVPNYDVLTNSAWVKIVKDVQEGVTSEAYSNDYDSVSHSITVDTDGGTAEYFVDGDWTDVKPMYRDVTETNVIFRVTKPNYEDFIGTNSVTITRRKITFTSADATKVYDMTPLTTNEVRITSGAFPGEEGCDTVCTGSQTDIGSTENTFDYIFRPGAKSGNYDIAVIEGTLTVTPCPIGPVPEDPDHPEGPFTPAPGFTIPPVGPFVYDGDPQEPEVAVTNGVVELVNGTDYVYEYGNNTNATEEAYVVITGIGNYCGVFTNYFAILPRAVTLKSGTKTMYLTNDTETVVCSNGFVWVSEGSFVTNAVTATLDGFTASVTNYLESAEPAGPLVNAFEAVVDPGLATNYCFSYEFGILQILSSPTNAQEEIHEEVPSPYGGAIDVVMDNNEAGPYAADKPPELNDEAAALAKDPTDKVEFRLTISTNYSEEAFVDVSNDVVAAATTEMTAAGKTAAQIAKAVSEFKYDVFDIAVDKIHEYRDSEGRTLNVETNDYGNKITQLLTIRIPYTFGPKLVSFSVWRNHTNGTDGVAAGIAKLPYYAGSATDEAWETNASEVVLHVQKFSVYVFHSTFLTVPQLTGRMQWKYFQAENAFYGALDVVCTNGDYAAISNLCYVYEDRNGLYLRDPRGAAKLSSTSRVVYDGAVFGKVPLDAAPLQNNGLWFTNRYGVCDAMLESPRFVVSNAAERTIALYTKAIPDLATNRVSAAVEETLGYISWQEAGYDDVFWCPLSANRTNLVLTCDIYASVNSMLGAAPSPLSLATLNKALVFGLPALTADSDPDLAIDAFDFDRVTARGRVVTRSGGSEAPPGPAARLTVLGARTPGDDFVEIGTPALASDGTFELAVPEGICFFRVRLVATEVIK